MNAACSSCGAQHSLPAAQLACRSRLHFRCAKCGKSTIVEIVQGPDVTQLLSPLPEFTQSAGAPRQTRRGGDEEVGLRLPSGKSITLSVIEGPDRGMVYSVEKSRIVIGRADADIVINDNAISRWHCAIEIQDEVIRLRDLESRNGTYLADERVRFTKLNHSSVFRIGGSIVMINITAKLTVPPQ